LTLGDGGKMKLDTEPVPVGMVELMNKKVLVRTDQAEMTKGKNVVVFDELLNRMKPRTQRLACGRRMCCRSPLGG
jgi:hypothetical protein